MKKPVLMLMLALSLCFVTVGCGEKEAETEVEETVEIEVEETVEYQVIGNESEDAYKVLLTNSVGQDIKGIAIKTSDKEEYPANMMKTDEVLKDGDTAELYYTPETTEAADIESTEKAVNIVYNVQLTFADDSVYELSSFGFDDIKETAELCLEDEVVFIKYISAATDDEISTKEQEIGAKEQKAAEEAAAKAAEEAAAAQKAAEEAAAQQAAQSQTTNNNYSGSSSSSTSSSTSGGSTTTTPSQGSESCLGGGVEVNQGSESCLGGGVEVNQDSESCLGGVEVNP